MICLIAIGTHPTYSPLHSELPERRQTPGPPPGPSLPPLRWFGKHLARHPAPPDRAVGRSGDQVLTGP